jgi:GT2 family glycosyltransferase
MSITVAIPTYNRGAILVETVRRLLALDTRAEAILLVDQTRQHPEDVNAQLTRWNEAGDVSWIRLPEPSVPHAMNVALLEARTPLVLFLDDDIEPSPGLVAEHLRAHAGGEVAAAVGQILQPGETPQHHVHPADDLQFHFNHDEACDVTNVMAGNLSVNREAALSVGGFDENYVGAAYRFESDFALRLVAAGGRIRFEPHASLRHLKISTGGLRSFGDHRVTISPLHAVGDYYFALKHRKDRFWRYAARRLMQNVATRYHLRHPWTIPTKLTGELRGIALARRLDRAGAKLLGNRSGYGGLPREKA